MTVMHIRDTCSMYGKVIERARMNKLTVLLVCSIPLGISEVSLTTPKRMVYILFFQQTKTESYVGDNIPLRVHV